MSRIRKSGLLPYLKYPLHYKGAPQRRLFFPDWYVKVLKPDEENIPKNYVKLAIPHDMTKYNVKEYLDKIYNVPVAKVDLQIIEWRDYVTDGPEGKTKFMEPYKIAHVHLGKGQKFTFPEIVKKKGPVEIPTNEEDYDMDKNQLPIESMEGYQKFKKQSKSNIMPKPLSNTWFMK